jgi:hypothetical protein
MVINLLINLDSTNNLRVLITQCNLNSVLCVSNNILSSITNGTNQQSVTFKSKLYTNKILPIQQNDTHKVFSQNSLDFSINTGTNQTNNNTQLPIKLRMPHVESNNTDMSNTVCIQYDSQGNADYNSCITWYDYNNSQIHCTCSNQGLSTNIYDKTLASLNKLKQFPALLENLCKYK